jgi:predicted amidohydrolase
MTITIGGCQIPVTTNISNNISEIKKAIDWASGEGVQILGTPECVLSGYMWGPESDDDPRVIAVKNGLEEIKAYSKLKKVDIVLGTAYYNENNKWANTQQFIIDGEIAHVHYKNATYEPYYEAGKGVKAIEWNGLKIAGSICNDHWANPFQWADVTGNLLQSLKEQGTNIVFVSANVPKLISPDDILWRWHNVCIEMFAMAGKWIPVVCDNPYLITGDIWEGRCDVQSGIFARGRTVRAKVSGTDYFKFSY